MIVFYILHTMMYMQAILDKPIRVQHVITTNPKQAKAIEDPSRSKIVQLLYMKSMHAEQIGTALKRTGSKKALTTIRHHIDVLTTIRHKRRDLSKWYEWKSLGAQ